MIRPRGVPACLAVRHTLLRAALIDLTSDPGIA